MRNVRDSAGGVEAPSGLKNALSNCNSY